MSNFINVSLKKENSFKELFSYLNLAIEKILNDDFFVFYDTYFSSVTQNDLIRIVSLFEGTSEEMMIRNLILDGLNKCKFISGSEIVCLLTFLYLANSTLPVKQFSSNREHFKASQRVKLNQSLGCLNQYLGKEEGRLIETIIQTAGANGQIFIEKSKLYTENTLICIDGFSFTCNLVPEFEAIVGIELHKKNFLAVFIDGIIESVGEADHIFRFSYENKQSIVLFCRGYAPDVISTMATNYLRGTLDVIPIHVGYDLKGANMLKDIAVVCNSDVVSSLKGELISTIDLQKLQFVQGIDINKKGIMIRNQSDGLKYIYKHCRNKKKKKNPTTIDLLNSRIQSLSSRFVKVYVGNINNREIILERLEEGIKIFKEIANFGLIKTKSGDFKIQKDLSFPTRSFFYGLEIGNSLYNTYQQIGCFLTKSK